MKRDVEFEPKELKKIFRAPKNIRNEPVSNFPLSYYEYFLKEIKRLGIKVITYKDLFHDSDDWNYRDFYPVELANWNSRRNKNDTYLVIQHDIDNHPFFTKRMLAMEAAYGIRSNIFLFCERYSKNGPDSSYIIDHPFFLKAQNQGFVIGYHQNAFALSGFDMSKAIERYRADVNQLRAIYQIDFVVPHGGAGSIVNGKMLHNVDVPIPKELIGNLRWVYNRYGVKFDRKWSDGGLGKSRDIERIRNLDLVNSFLHKLKKGTRNFCLIHPQRWGYNVDTQVNPLLAKEEWYRNICSNNKLMRTTG